MLFERDDWASNAYRIIYQRVRELPEYAEAHELVLQASCAECRGLDVPAMRAIGGFSEVIRRHTAALPEKFRANHGSRLIPYTVADMLRADIADLRQAVQWACRRHFDSRAEAGPG